MPVLALSVVRGVDDMVWYCGGDSPSNITGLDGVYEGRMSVDA